MKKVFICLFTLIILTGCVNINNASMDQVISFAMKDKHKMLNKNNKGFKYYLPRDMAIEVYDDFNVLLKDSKHDYYLYVDLVSYFHKQETSYEEDSSIYYSKKLKKKDKKGIINIYKTDDDNEYLIKMSYNYASISVICEKININNVVANALMVLSSIEYNDDIISSVLADSEYTGREEPVVVFKIENNASNSLDIDDTYVGNEEEDYDPDVISRGGN